MAARNQHSYTDPDLRRRLKDEIMKGDKGGRPGQWSARKSQLLAHEYEAHGGGYKGEKSEAAKSLDKWTDEKWTTKDGKKAERNGETHRYLPEKAWEELTPEQQRATDRKKVSGSTEGIQFVPNTAKAKSARKAATSSKCTFRQLSVQSGAPSKPCELWPPFLGPNTYGTPKSEAEG